MLQTEYVKSLTFGLNLSHKTYSVKNAYFSVSMLSQSTSQ